MFAGYYTYIHYILNPQPCSASRVKEMNASSFFEDFRFP